MRRVRLAGDTIVEETAAVIRPRRPLAVPFEPLHAVEDSQAMEPAPARPVAPRRRQLVDLSVFSDEVRQLLAEMATVSEAPAARLDRDGSAHGKPEGGRPTGPAETMLERWASRFAGVVDENRLRVLMHLARRELLSARKAKPLMLSRDPETGAVQRDEDGEPLREDSWQRDERIIDWYEGMPAVEAALLESTIGPCSAANIRRVRARNDRHRDTGLPVEPSERRRARARELDVAGLGERRIAREMGVSRGTVRRLLERPSVDRKAAA